MHIDGMGSALDTLMRDSRARAGFAQRAVDARDRFSMEKISRMWEAVFTPSTCAHGVKDDVVAE